MTDRRGPQPLGEDRSDLTPDAATHAGPYGPAEARAEIEAFMGEGWRAGMRNYGTPKDVAAHNIRVTISVHGYGPTYRAAVDALKQAWRDAVRPWVIAGVKAGHENVADNGDDLLELPATLAARVLKEDQ